MKAKLFNFEIGFKRPENEMTFFSFINMILFFYDGDGFFFMVTVFFIFL